MVCLHNPIIFSKKIVNTNPSFFKGKNDLISQCIVSTKTKNIVCDNEAKLYLQKNEFVKDKKLISISPGGFKGFYLLGTTTFIKENYNLDNFIYSGASAGAWNSLFMCYKKNPMEFVYKLLDSDIKKSKNINDLQYLIKYKLLSSYKEEDFDLDRLFIGVTSLKNFKSKTNIYSDFSSLDDAINCCIASSHIPLITGGFSNRYNNMYSFDGGFSNYPYLDFENHVLHIYPAIWDDIERNNKKTNCYKKYSELFSISKNNLLQLFDDGYQDAKKHKSYLDLIFMNHTESNLCETNTSEIDKILN
jgi:hypothetical protein